MGYDEPTAAELDNATASSDSIALFNQYLLRVVDAYIYKRQEENSDFKPNPNFQKQYHDVFSRVALICLQESVSPELYVNACFDFNAVPNFPVNTLISNKFIQYVKSKELLLGVKEVIENDFKSSFILFHRHYTELNRPVEEVLLDIDLYFTPMFRFVMACKFKCIDVIKKYKDLALVQAYEQPLYYQIYNPLIPQDYHNEFKAIIPKYFGPGGNS
jgi:hypothetical protein